MGEDLLKRFGDIKVSEIMIRDPQFSTPDQKISTTELLLLRKKFGGLPVLNDFHQVIGIITQRDIRLARFVISLETSYTLVRDLMTPEPYTVKRDDTIKVVLEKLIKHKIERLPVVDDKNVLVGLVLQRLILKKLFEYLKK